MESVEKTIVSQYANSPTLAQLIQNMNGYIDPSTDFDMFYDFIWNVDTAQGFGLDIWGKIVNVSRRLYIPPPLYNLGFDEGVNFQPFGQAPLYAGPPDSNVYFLQDDAYRTLILVKALANISDCTAPSLNQLLKNLFSDRGRCYVSDVGGMQLRFTFEFLLLPYEFAILTQSGAIPCPAGVEAFIVQVETPGTFGFYEAIGAEPFGLGAFFSQGVIHAN